MQLSKYILNTQITTNTSLIQKETFTSYHTFLYVFYKKVLTITLVYFF